jgi:HK97 family phage prohead protease
VTELTGRHKHRVPVEVELKADSDETGEFVATFSRFNVIDLDGDVTEPGAFEQDQKARVAQWGHAWGSPIIGVGVVKADDMAARFYGQFNLKMMAGRENYESVKMAGELQEWSYGFDILEWSYGQFNGTDVRFLKKMRVIEVSPVMLGAGIGTGTDSIKSLTQLMTEGDRFTSELDIVLAAMRGTLDRASDIAKLRGGDGSKEGRTFSSGNVEKLTSHADTAEAIAKGIRELIAGAAKEPKSGARDAMLAGIESVRAELSALGIAI